MDMRQVFMATLSTTHIEMGQAGDLTPQIVNLLMSFANARPGGVEKSHGKSPFCFYFETTTGGAF